MLQLQNSLIVALIIGLWYQMVPAAVLGIEEAKEGVQSSN